MKVVVVGYTTGVVDAMEEATGDEWFSTGEGGASDLSEFAGRACYQSWSRPNETTATNDGYLANILMQQHFSVLEHGSVSMYVSGVSRSLTHELIRHRHFSFSQLSQRFVRLDKQVDEEMAFVIPPLFRGNNLAEKFMVQVFEQALLTYQALCEIGDRIVDEEEDPHSRLKRTKRVREAARAVLPNMMPTSLVITGNHRAWREMLHKRGTNAADAEIREFALKAFTLLKDLEPNLYQDGIISLSDGVEVIQWQ